MPTPIFTTRRLLAVRTPSTKQARDAARSLLVTSLLIGGLTLGSAATFEYGSLSSHFVVSGQMASGPIPNSPWMY
jgi:hypothetical protein